MIRMFEQQQQPRQASFWTTASPQKRSRRLDVVLPQANMQSFLVLALAALSIASPVPVPVVEERTVVAVPVVEERTVVAAPVVEERTVIEERQSTTGITSNEYTQLGCRNVIFFFARGSTEVGNMVCPVTTRT
jgi:hypothetical protein